MASQYSVDYEQLENVGTLLRSVADQIEQTIHSTQQQVDGMLVSFTGDARVQFDAMFAAWGNSNLANVNAMIEYAANVAKAAGQYGEAATIARDLLKPDSY
jgi:WXG100 family type VII secretion target